MITSEIRQNFIQKKNYGFMVVIVFYILAALLHQIKLRMIAQFVSNGAQLSIKTRILHQTIQLQTSKSSSRPSKPCVAAFLPSLHLIYRFSAFVRGYQNPFFFFFLPFSFSVGQNNLAVKLEANGEQLILLRMSYLHMLASDSLFKCSYVAPFGLFVAIF